MNILNQAAQTAMAEADAIKQQIAELQWEMRNDPDSSSCDLGPELDELYLQLDEIRGE